MHISTRVKAYLSLIAVAIIWGAASVVIKGTMEYLRPMEFLYYRFTLLLPIIIPWYLYELKKNPIRWRDIVPLTIFGLMATTVYLSMIFWGFARTTAIDGNLLGTLNPLFIIILGVLFLKEKVTNREKIGFIITFIGVIITIIQPFLEGAAFALKNTWGNTIIVSATIVWALFVLLSKRMQSTTAPY